MAETFMAARRSFYQPRRWRNYSNSPSVDLLQSDKESAEVMVVTRAQTKNEEARKHSLQILPFNVQPKAKKSRREKRQSKIEGTEIVEKLPIPYINDIEHIPHNIVQLQRQDQTLKSLFEKAEKGIPSSLHQKDHFLIKDDRLYVQGPEGEREVPQASTGYSPFELLYGRQVRGPLDVLKEAWEADKGSEHMNVLSCVIKMRDKLDALTEMVNMAKAQQQQKKRYDQSSRNRVLSVGQKVLLLLPTSDSSLLAKWQGPYEVVRKLSATNYEIFLPDRRKKKQVFHINLLQPWHERKGLRSEQLWARRVDEEEEDAEQYFPAVKDPF
ncbi:hypothetical protein QQF64_020498 [Cirrhinus molitorella]|uniref:Integrase p58-like C-terminal domain-containing protein n=1 Tax=Cirrhinus molitorella TaxID=172907 RepID=A0ABR3L9L8_9TELE